jgi:Tfp pilus assembly protein PilN
MIQFNLLPDVKLEYIRAQRTKRLVVTTAVLATAGALALLIVLSLTVFVFQKQYMNHVSSDIKKYSSDLKSTPDLDKILTIQNQLNSLTDLHEQKPDTNRIIPFIEQVTPPSAQISSLNVDFDALEMKITGSADTLQTVNQFVDTLKFTHYVDNSDTPLAFSNVVLATFGRADKGASYSITANFDIAIFDNTKTIQLTVPDKVTTRSETEKPTTLFETTPTSGGQN